MQEGELAAVGSYHYVVDLVAGMGKVRRRVGVADVLQGIKQTALAAMLVHIPEAVVMQAGDAGFVQCRQVGVAVFGAKRVQPPVIERQKILAAPGVLYRMIVASRFASPAY